MLAVVNKEGQVTIPKRVRDLLGLQTGSRVDFRQDPDSKVVIERADDIRQENPFARWRGVAGGGLTTDEIMAMSRGED